MEKLSERAIRTKKAYLKKGLEPDVSLIEEFKYTPPKPKYSISQIVEKAKKENLSYGKYVALRHAKGVKL